MFDQTKLSGIEIMRIIINNHNTHIYEILNAVQPHHVLYVILYRDDFKLEMMCIDYRCVLFLESHSSQQNSFEKNSMSKTKLGLKTCII